MSEQREEWPRIGRASRAGQPPTDLQEKIIEYARGMNAGPFGEAVSEEELTARFPDAAETECAGISTNRLLDLELYDAVIAGWLRIWPGGGYEPWERPRPERTDLPVEDREARKKAGDEAWTDSSGTKHMGDMAYEGDDAAMAQALDAIQKEQL